MDNFISILRDANSPEELEELKIKLFRENVRIKTDKADLEDMRVKIQAENDELSEKMRLLADKEAEIEIAKLKFDKEVAETNRKLEEEKKKLENDLMFLNKKQMVLESGFKQLDVDRQRLYKEKEEFKNFKERTPIKRTVPSLEYRQGIFFKGVTSETGLKKRYKDLIKVFHPDNFNGDNDTLQNINREYETLLHDLQMRC